MEDFVHLHVHTYYSTLDGQSPVKALVDKAIADGQRGMAITDHGNMFGVKELFDYSKKKNKALTAEGKAPFKPIFGCEMYVAHNRKEDKVKEHGDASGYHLIVLAKNYNGYKNLIKLVSRSWVDGFYYRPRTDRADLVRFHEDLIVCSACIAGEVPAKILRDDIEGAREAIEWYHRVFGDDYYLEIQRHEVKDPNIRANRDTFPLQQRANKVILELAEEYGIKVVCTNDAHFLGKEYAEAHDHLLCLGTKDDIDDPNRMLYSKQEWFKTREEMNEVFSDVPFALSNTLEVLDKVELYSIDHDPIMPNFPIPESFGTEEALRQQISAEELIREFTSDENGENTLPIDEGMKKIEHLGGVEKLYRIKFEAEYLRYLTYEGAKKLYGEPLSKEVDDRIRFELHVMKTMGFPGYFLIVQDFINAARNELGVMVGPGRGSAAGSVVAYCLGITRINPLKYDLLFERFLNPDRISLPDIDTDFDDDGRGKVLKWVEDKYGYENCAHIITYSTMATKNAIKDVARVEKLPLARANALCKAIPDRLPNKLKMNLQNAIKYTPELQEAEHSSDPKEANTIHYAKQLEGTIRGTGIHACGFIICRDPISEWVPISTADDPDFPDEKTNCTQYDGHVIESTGLIKMDFLGLTTLSELKEAIRNVQLTKGITVDIDHIPLDDPLTYQLYKEGRTIGTFQFESTGMQRYLKELHPTVFEDLIAMNALYRPGPMDHIPEFIKRKNDPSLIKYDVPCMEKYLKDTYGITVYQEQVMLLSRELANFTRGESDVLRKAMGKKQIDTLNQLKPKFLNGGKEKGYSEEILEKIWGEWEKFAEYAFNKSHATCYSWVAYQTAYMKAHYPAEYMAAIMSRRKDDSKQIAKLMDECRKMGIATLGPDVNESYQKFGVNQKGEIRYGLSAIQGVGDAAGEAILKERQENGAFKDIYDFVERIDMKAINSKAMESLALAGAFDSFGIRREQFVAPNNKGESFLDTLLRYGKLYQAEKEQASFSLFGDTAVEIAHPPIPECLPWSKFEMLEREKALVGIYLSAHPLDDYRNELHRYCNTQCPDLEDREALSRKQIVTFGGIVTSVEERYTKSQKKLGIVKIEDFEGTGELTFFDKQWTEKWCNRFRVGDFVHVTAQCGKRYPQSEYYELTVKEIMPLKEVANRHVSAITIDLNTSEIDTSLVEGIKKSLKKEKGNTLLRIHLKSNQHSEPLSLKSANYIVLTNELISFLDNNEVKYALDIDA